MSTIQQVGMVVQACNSRAWEMKAEGSGVQGQAGLHNEFKAS